jgi:aryl-alcohol dehydrogenase-like predicted oxidoreductase
MQNHYNLVYREEEREMIPLCLDQGVGVVPYSPLARGLLGGNRTRPAERGAPGHSGSTTRSSNDPLAQAFYNDADFDIVDVVAAVAGEHGAAPAQIALSWLLGKPAVSAPIVGMTRLHHVNDAIAALDVTLTNDETARLEAPYRPHPVLGHS